jgi:serine/threonine protein kinase
LADEPGLIGETLDQKYKLVLLLGEGGMGSVYQAEREGTAERVAVKVIQSRLLGRNVLVAGGSKGGSGGSLASAEL